MKLKTKVCKSFCFWKNLWCLFYRMPNCCGVKPQPQIDPWSSTQRQNTIAWSVPHSVWMLLLNHLTTFKIEVYLSLRYFLEIQGLNQGEQETKYYSLIRATIRWQGSSSLSLDKHSDLKLGIPFRNCMNKAKHFSCFIWYVE